MGIKFWKKAKKKLKFRLEIAEKEIGELQPCGNSAVIAAANSKPNKGKDAFALISRRIL